MNLKEEMPAPGIQIMKIPSDFIIYRCKIGGGRILDIALPPQFKQIDVERLYAFLKTQIDDDTGVFLCSSS